MNLLTKWIFRTRNWFRIFKYRASNNLHTNRQQNMITLSQFSTDFKLLTKDWSWEVEGFLDTAGYVHPIDTDTKVISTVFERLASPVVRSIAKKYGYVVETANQTTYPDFTLTKKNGNTVLHRVALDVKTTYRSNMMLLTLGGYNSFLRNDSKNILYPYSTYHDHWILGFIYEQKSPFPEYDLDNMPKQGVISCPYSNVFVFIREKYAISGVRAGSGNTKNIGSIKLPRPSDFATATGPFTAFRDAKGACDHFWRHYETYVLQINSQADLLVHADFDVFK